MNNNATMRRLGDYIRQVDARNRDLKVTRLVGVNLDKEFMPSVANTVGTDMATYKIVSYNQFGCKLMSVERDRKMPISLMKDQEPALISSAYYVFEVLDENILDPDFLFLQIKSPEFDRRLWFSSGGDVRGGVGFDNLADMPISVPPIEEQREIVARHKAIEYKIDVNRRLIAKLEETARTIYHHTFVENIDPENLPAGMYWSTILGFCKEIKSGGTPSRSNPKYWNSKNFRWLKTGEVHNCIIHDTEEYISHEGLDNSSAKLIDKGSVVMAMYGATAAQIGFLDCDTTTNQACCNMTCFSKEQAAYLYFHLLAKQDEIRRLANGGAQENLSQELIANQPIIEVYDSAILKPFESIITQLIIFSRENKYLLELLNSVAL